MLAMMLRVARRLGAPDLARRIPPHEIDSYAYSLSYMLRARAWSLRQRAPSWPALERAWRSTDAGAVRAALSGRLAPGDDIRLVVDGGEAFDLRDRLLLDAHWSVDLSTYYVQADATGWRTAQNLVACAARGIRVRLLVDRYMLQRKRRETPGLGSLVEFLRRGGVQVRLWHDPQRPFDSNHRKMLVVDRQTALLGGRNFADHYRLDLWRDVDLLLRGPSVVPLSNLFELIWRPTAASDQPSPGVSPWFDYQPRAIVHEPTVRYTLACIECAQRAIRLELAYLVGPSALTDGLVNAARRGVQVQVLTNSIESNDLPYATYAACAGVAALLAGGVDVRLRRGAGRTLHSKYLVVDDTWVAFGSHNLDYYSTRYCGETTLQVESRSLATQLDDCFAGGIQDSEPADLHGEVLPFLKRSRGLRFFNWAFRDFQ